jgi:hypothetical protein
MTHRSRYAISSVNRGFPAAFWTRRTVKSQKSARKPVFAEDAKNTACTALTWTY